MDYKKLHRKIYGFLLLIIIIFFFFIHKIEKIKEINIKKRIGVISCANTNNVGNNLVKFAMYTKLKELNLEPVIIALTRHKNIYFIKNHVKLKEINQSYQELKEEDYDFLVVNSDQTWANVTPNYLLDYGYLRFAKKWKIPKFVYGASFPFYSWTFSKQFNIQASNLLKYFSGISVREKQTVYLAMENLGVKPEFVLDPTLLIDKKYYLDLIKDYNQTFNFELNFLCVYQLDNNIQI